MSATTPNLPYTLRAAGRVYHRSESWNRSMVAKGYTHAVIPVPPRRVRLIEAACFVRDNAREAVALRIAPWLNSD